MKIPVSHSGPGRGVWEQRCCKESEGTPAESGHPAAPHLLSCKPATMKDISNFFQATRILNIAFPPICKLPRCHCSALLPAPGGLCKRIQPYTYE